jgi:plastocyanin
MKNYAFGLLIAAGTLLAAGCYPTQPGSTSATMTSSKNTVQMSNDSYHPPKIVIYRGESVTWVNHDSVSHTVTSKEFNSGNIAPGSYYTYQFNKSGTYNYYSTDRSRMTGVVVVK